MAATTAKITLEHEECRHMALALEGLAGAIHAGHPVLSRDVTAAADLAWQVWQAGPDPGPSFDRDFEASCLRLGDSAAGAARASPKEAAAAGRAALDLARELRRVARDLAGKPARGDPPKAMPAILKLQANYGRYGIRPTSAA